MMFKRSLLALAAIAAFLSPAAAADLPVKAPTFFAPAVCSLMNCSGWYVGGAVSGNGTNADVLGSGLSQSIFAAGAIVDGHAGYQVWNGNLLFGVEAGVGNQFSNGPVSAFGSKTLIGYEGIKLGGSLAGLFSVAPTTTTTVPGQAPGALPVFSSIANNFMSAYVWLGMIQRGGYNQGTTGVGTEYVLAQNWNLDARYTYAPAFNSLPPMQQLTLGLNYHFSLR